MKVISKLKPRYIFSAAWLNGICGGQDIEDEDDELPRFDAVRALTDRNTGISKVKIFKDNGLAILDCSISEFQSTEHEFNNIINLLRTDVEAISYCESLVISILSYQTNIEISDCSEKDDSLTLNEFFGLSSYKESNDKNLIKIDNKIAQSGISAGILSRNENRLDPILKLGVETELSALNSAYQMQNDRVRHQINLPDGFEKIDLKAAKSALQAIPVPNASAVQFYGDSLSPFHKQRLQAAQAYPIFADSLESDVELQLKVDNGQPLAPILSQRLGLSRGHIKRLKKIQTPAQFSQISEFGGPTQEIDPFGGIHNRIHHISSRLTKTELVEMLRSYPANWSPENEQSWDAFIDIVATFAKPLNTTFDVPLDIVLAASKGKWGEYKSMLARNFGVQPKEFDRQQMTLASSVAVGMLDDFNKSIILPMLLQTIVNQDKPIPAPSSDFFVQGQKLAYQLITGNSKNVLSNLLAAAKDWTSRTPALMEADGVNAIIDGNHDSATSAYTNAYGGDGILNYETIKEYENSESWPRLIENFTSSNGLVIQNLTSKEELKEESLRLSHCVGRLYLHKANSGKCHIFSIRNSKLTESYSTIELSPVLGTAEQDKINEFKIWQHKARNNRKPTEKADLASKEWLKAIRSGEISADIDKTKAWREHQNIIHCVKSPGQLMTQSAIRVQWLSALGGNWLNQEVLDALWQEWKTHILHGSLSRLENPTNLHFINQTIELLTALCPETASAVQDNI